MKSLNGHVFRFVLGIVKLNFQIGTLEENLNDVSDSIAINY